MKRIGLIVNPVAGLGGISGLKGSDDVRLQNEALSMGYEKTAYKKAQAAFKKLSELKDQFGVITVSGQMGWDSVKDLGYSVNVLPNGNTLTTASDTRLFARSIVNEGADLLVFAGGDGTAMDIYDAVSDSIPVVGIPAGVKIYSAVYALSPAVCGDLLCAFVSGKTINQEKREVMDLDEKDIAENRVSSRLYGYLNVINTGNAVQHKKESAYSEKHEVDSICGKLIRDMKEGAYYIIGPGSTTAKLMELMGLCGTLIGVDVVQNGRIVLKDCDEKLLYSCIKGTNPYIVVTSIGGQGYVFGRGNQQISPRVIGEAGKDHIVILTTKQKIADLRGRPFLTDTGDSSLDKYLKGMYRIDVNYNESVFYKMSDGK